MTLKRIAGALLVAPVAALLLAAMPHPAQADPPFTPPGHAKKGGPGKFGHGEFGHGGFCPPGLRDKGCMPPGLQRFGRGDRIPDWRSYDRLRYREYGLPAPGAGREYIRIGGDAYLIAEGTARVLEAISLFGAVRD